MREIRQSGSEGGGAGYITGSPYPYPTAVPSGTPDKLLFQSPGQGRLSVARDFNPGR